MTDITKSIIKQRLGEIQDLTCVIYNTVNGITEAECLKTVADVITEKADEIESLLNREEETNGV